MAGGGLRAVGKRITTGRAAQSRHRISGLHTAGILGLMVKNRR
jgi:hypothetical protein